MVQSARRLTARPAESEYPGAEINHFQEQQSLSERPETEINYFQKQQNLREQPFLFIPLMKNLHPMHNSIR
ncbi:hypothetical protein ABE41_012510 [Fictibacillus arsenicus]|uniref:Uncharacterized protein n=1 Tax=Fictibacillus arsenicus TaxID=255247 RepID=A0A1B1Z5T2_9BACL|nr:hypothetical protein ABE41_012510 [Fictibacillus arsenicus]